MIYVLLLYGLPFIGLGIAMSLQARSQVWILPRRCLWLLCTFGFVHGTAEWLAMAHAIENLAWLRLGNVVLTALSFAALMHFGIELQIHLA